MAEARLVRHSYALIRHWMRRRSRPGDLLDETRLREFTGGSRTEIREVLAALADDGVLDRRRRAGTQLEEKIADISLDLPIAYEPTAEDHYRHVVLRQAATPASPILLDAFGEPAEDFFLVEDSRIELNRRPLALRTSFWRGGEGRRPSPVGRPGADMAQSFRATFGTALAECEAHVDALRASDRLAARLRILPGQPVLLREAVLRGADGRVHEVSYTYYASSRVSLRVVTQY